MKKSNSKKILINIDGLFYENTKGSLFDNTNLSLFGSKKIGLIGYNGSGKSTLLKIIAGQIAPQGGSIAYANDLQLAMVEQEFPNRLEDLTISEAMIDALPAAMQLDYHWRADVVLTDLGFNYRQISQLCRSLSGGEKTKLLLGRSLMSEPDMLILDEPSNHLDLPTLLWLEQFLLNWRGCFILVSHDRQFLDKVTNYSWIIANANIYAYGCSCAKALKLHAAYQKSLDKQFQAETKEINRLETSAHRLAIWGKVYDNEGLSRKAKSMYKRIDRLNDQKTIPLDQYPWHLSFPGQRLKADVLIKVEHIAVTPGINLAVLFKIDQWLIAPGDRISIIGHNGCGKSTFLNMLWSNYLDFDINNGAIKYHPTAKIAYYDQMLDNLPDKLRLKDALQSYIEKSGYVVSDEQIKMALIKAGFDYERHQQRVFSLSSGEKARAMLVGISLMNSNALIFDEPTNHLDLFGKQQLIKQLNDYPSAVILVSHDRDFIENTCSQFFAIKNGRWTKFLDPAAAYRHIA